MRFTDGIIILSDGYVTSNEDRARQKFQFSFMKRGKLRPPEPFRLPVEGIFFDYDGTLSRMDISRNKSVISGETVGLLQRLKLLIPIGIITTKDLSFIVPRTSFAHMWCGIGGLEMRLNDVFFEDACVEPMIPNISGALKEAHEIAGDSIYIETKLDHSGRVLAFCLDWRQSLNYRKDKRTAGRIAELSESMGLFIVRYPGQPFIDIYPCELNKGKALLESKRKLGIAGNVIYMGDSKIDNPAFRAADIAIGFLRGRAAKELECKYLLKYQDMPVFLRHMLSSGLIFDSAYPEISLNRERI